MVTRPRFTALEREPRRDQTEHPCLGRLAGELAGDGVGRRQITVNLACVGVGFRQVGYVRGAITWFLKIRVSAVRFRP